MENQHRKISGYRELTQDEIDLMNEIKQKGKELQLLIDKIGTTPTSNPSAEPGRWLSMARTDLQVGIMKLTRAVAQPDFF
jgi:hypothetical protein